MATTATAAKAPAAMEKAAETKTAASSKPAAPGTPTAGAGAGAGTIRVPGRADGESKTESKGESKGEHKETKSEELVASTAGGLPRFKFHNNTKASTAELMALLPPESHPEHFFRLNWITHITQNNGMVTCDFVAQMGRSVHLIDIRGATDLVGPLGYIPGVDWVAAEHIDLLATELERDAVVVFIDADDVAAQQVAQYAVEKLNMRFVAAMRGGMKGWRFMGFSTIRDDAILLRSGRLRKTKESAKYKLQQRMCGCAADEKSICLSEIRHHIGDPLNIQWLKMAAFLVHGRQSCVDGRDDSGVIGTPGGDMGEFVLALTVAEQLIDKKFSYDEIDLLLRRRLDAFGRFYMHTDMHALERLQAKLRADPRLKEVFAPIKDPLSYRMFMRSPPKAYRAAIMEHQLNPAHLGCGHLRLMVTQPASYKVRPKLILHTLKAFFTARWNGSIECEYMALSGNHSEGGVINVHMTQKVASFTRIPLISPSCNGKQIFVNHPQISSYLRQQGALFLSMQHDIIKLSEGAKDEFYPKMEALANSHLGSTLTVLAAGLPIYEIKFDQQSSNQHTFTVKKLKAAHEADLEEDDL